MLLARKESTLYIGLTGAELEDLRTGKQVHVSLARVLANMDCYIVTGETYEEIAAKLGLPPEQLPERELD